MITISIVLAIVAAIRWKHRTQAQRFTRWWFGAAALWIAWAFLYFEWNAIEHCSRPPALVANRPIVCIGDSLTDGMRPDRGYPDQLKAMVSVPVVNCGFSGISTSQGLGQMERVLGHDPQVVIIELGGHDFLKGYSRQSTKANLLKMIRQCRDHGAEVVLMEIPRGFIFDPYASLEREIAYQEDLELVPDTWLRQIVIMGPASLPGLWMPESRLSDDGIHSNPKGSFSIAKHVLRALHRMYGDKILAAKE
ncbi:GDSL-type esterase/lipase family protein [Rubripirellula reticaptiva]|uniref:GDSL-type esterase/lipase family protein n=1 Tax=Rubripirellula reticaptiva TaxID=2528013 RepID=UPI001FE5A221|nr:GDSL-type esterase/lipase family protein [Rubripirellula reticaptiva]